MKLFNKYFTRTKDLTRPSATSRICEESEDFEFTVVQVRRLRRDFSKFKENTVFGFEFEKVSNRESQWPAFSERTAKFAELPCNNFNLKCSSEVCNSCLKNVLFKMVRKAVLHA